MIGHINYSVVSDKGWILWGNRWSDRKNGLLKGQSILMNMISFDRVIFMGFYYSGSAFQNLCWPPPPSECCIGLLFLKALGKEWNIFFVLKDCSTSPWNHITLEGFSIKYKHSKQVSSYISGGQIGEQMMKCFIISKCKYKRGKVCIMKS